MGQAQWGAVPWDRSLRRTHWRAPAPPFQRKRDEDESTVCGIAGFLLRSPALAADAAASHVRPMLEAIRHRGPDDEGFWYDGRAGIMLGHRRLSIVDLSPAGHQPMLSADGRYALVLNGEIYNHADLRRAHADYPFRGHSDTEVALAVMQARGIGAALERFVGMFAFAIWDRRERALTLVRDRLGEKPLYYGWVGDRFLFGSELKALRANPVWQGEIDRDAIGLLLQYTYIPGPWTIYREIRKLEPGHLLTVRADDRRTPASESYWSARETVMRGKAMQGSHSREPKAAVDALEALLKETIARQMIADVPLGAFLSGGVDSSVVVALMQAQSARKVRTFSIGFHEDGYNEAHEAKRVAAHLGTEHTELYVTPAEARAVIPRLPELYDEPFADSSQIPTFLVSQLARSSVTVALSGDGGDELFAGYSRYARGRALWTPAARGGLGVRKAMARAMSAFSPRAINAFARALGPLLPPAVRGRDIGNAWQRRALLCRGDSPQDVYRPLITLWQEPREIVRGSTGPDLFARFSATLNALPDITEYMTFFDLVTYLPDDILTKVDRASMGVSLEVRVPFLDHRIVEFAWSLPVALKVVDDAGKWILRQVLYRHCPPALVDRPKMGFGVPIDRWLRSELREWAEDLLAPERLKREAFFEPEPIRRKWQAHLAGEGDWHYVLWPVLMFQAWYAANGG